MDAFIVFYWVLGLLIFNNFNGWSDKMTQQTLTNLLLHVKTLNNHYKRIDELTGENFNIFRILKLESSEVRLHSAFLASLLDPKGHHGKKHAFLKLFIDRFAFKNNNIDLESCSVDIERHTGFINNDGTEGGRIDLIISDKKENSIIVENKIYAGDQANQLLRYHNYSPSADLIYLTLTGKEPSDGSCGSLEMGTHFKCYSYKQDITKWLEECRKEAVTDPIVRESITQYINLIKYLTNQTINQSMKRELNELLTSNLEEAFTVYDNLDSALDEIYDQFFLELNDYCESIGLKCYTTVDNDKNYTGIWINKPDWKFVNIGFQFQSSDRDLLYGIIAKKNPATEPIPDKLRSDLSSIPDRGKSSSWWPWSKYMEDPFRNWGKHAAWKSMLDGTMKQSMIQKINFLLQATKDIEL